MPFTVKLSAKNGGNGFIRYKKDITQMFCKKSRDRKIKGNKTYFTNTP